jgi:hypothetical protein
VGRRFVTFTLALMLAAVTPVPSVAAADPPPLSALPAPPTTTGPAAPGELPASPANPWPSARNPAPAGAAASLRADAPTILQVQDTGPPPLAEPPSSPLSPPPTPAAPTPPPKKNSAEPPETTNAEPPMKGMEMPLPAVDLRKIKFGQRGAAQPNVQFVNGPNGEQTAVVTGGVKVLISTEDKLNTLIDIEADQLVIWLTDGKPQELADAISDSGLTQSSDRQTEIYLTGNVEIRYGAGGLKNPDGTPLEDKIMRAQRVYCDLSRNKAIAVNADLEFFRPNVLAVPGHVKTAELWELASGEYQARDAVMSASVLPADPGFDLWLRRVTIFEEHDVPQRNFLGFTVIDRFTGENVIGVNRRFYAENAFPELAGVPFFWLPVFSGDPENPTGPLSNFLYRQDQIFGTQILTTWNLLEVLGVKRLPTEQFNLSLDYLSMRGPGAGVTYALSGPRLFGFDAPFTTNFLAYGIYDQGHDQLAGTREFEFMPPGYRDRVVLKHIQDFDDFQFQGQVDYQSDHNFLEQYYNTDFTLGPNQETFTYLKYQHGIGAITGLIEPNFDRGWVTEAEWYPRFDGYWLGQSFFDRFTYNTWGSAGYAHLQVYELPQYQLPAGVNPATLVTNENAVAGGRLDWRQDISAPFTLGAFKIVPYAKSDVASYSQDENYQQVGRVYGGFGTSVSLPFSKQYDDIQSEMFNVNGINHKITLLANYYNAWSNVPYTMLPQFDRLNDDATQQSVRDITPWQQVYVPGVNGNALFNSPLYNPQAYAIRNLVDTAADTLDSIQVLQLQLRQRWQTNRGYPGMEHTLDYITLDLGATYFPEKNRDDFGHSWALLQYNATWAVGDNNGFTSAGWMDPFAFGTRYWNATAYFTRPDNTNFNISYRFYDPVGSRQVSTSVNYAFSPKYSITFSTAYDFGLAQNQSTTLSLTRVGTDLTWNIGFSYNAIINNFSFNFMIYPNLLASQFAGGGFGTSSAAGIH